MEYTLPEYPCRVDMWDELAHETRPVMVYGMGNGADKLFSRLEKYGVTPREVFASDGFVRGHSFRGYKVKSFSEIREEYSDFVILLSFGTNRAEVLDMLAEIDGKYDMYVPDMPVAGEEEYFDRDFYNAHYDEIKSAYDTLADEQSRKTFSLVLQYKISGRMKYLEDAYSDNTEIYSLISATSPRSAIDGGAYSGDTLRQMQEYLPTITSAIAVEPDRRTFKRLSKYVSTLDSFDVQTYNAALWSELGEGSFASSANRNSTVSATASYEHREDSVPLITIDSIAAEKVDYIKYDVEGAEAEALAGSLATIRKYSPALRIAVYHRSRDIFSIINYMRENTENYGFYIRRTRCLPAWEIDLIMIPKEVDK